MTESAFIAIHTTQGFINFPTMINVNYDQIPDTNQGIVTGLTITTSPLTIDGVTDQSIESVLEQVENIQFNIVDINNPGTIYRFSFTVEDRAFYRTQNPFYYFRVVQDQIIPNIFLSLFSEELIQDVNVIFTPFLLQLEFQFSDFNTLINNVEINRPSLRRVKADRDTGGLLPINWESIISGTATPAEVQDSIYFDTGWNNARYQGSVTSAEEYGGISPAITGKLLPVEINPETATDSAICSTLDADRLFENVLQTSNEEVPTFSIGEIGISLNSNLNTVQDIINYSGIPSGSIDLGDIVRIGNEYMRVLNHNPIDKQIGVIRGYIDTSIVSHTAPLPISKIKSITLLKFTNNSSQVELVNNSKVFISKNRSILHTDDYGQVFSSSLCS